METSLARRLNNKLTIPLSIIVAPSTPLNIDFLIVGLVGEETEDCLRIEMVYIRGSDNCVETVARVFLKDKF
jgi:hypothetical protein